MKLESPAGSFLISDPAGYRLLDAWWAENRIAVHMLPDAAAGQRCSVCGASEVVRYGRGPVRILDAPQAGQRVERVISRQRLKCAMCLRLAREVLPDVADGRRISSQCREWISSQLPLRSNNAIAMVLGIDEKSVRTLAVEMGGERARSAPPGASSRCASCLRLYPADGPELRHSVGARPAGESPDALLLCSTCNDPDARWIWREPEGGPDASRG